MLPFVVGTRISIFDLQKMLRYLLQVLMFRRFQSLLLWACGEQTCSKISLIALLYVRQFLPELVLFVVYHQFNCDIILFTIENPKAGFNRCSDQIRDI